MHLKKPGVLDGFGYFEGTLLKLVNATKLRIDPEDRTTQTNCFQLNRFPTDLEPPLTGSANKVFKIFAYRVAHK